MFTHLSVLFVWILYVAEAFQDNAQSHTFGHFSNSSSPGPHPTCQDGLGFCSSSEGFPSQNITQTRSSSKPVENHSRGNRTSPASTKITSIGSFSVDISRTLTSKDSASSRILTSSSLIHSFSIPLTSQTPSSSPTASQNNTASSLLQPSNTEVPGSKWAVPWVGSPTTTSSSAHWTDKAESTITTTPPGASFLTLSDLTVITPIIITTTLPGSTEANGFARTKEGGGDDTDFILIPFICLGCFPGGFPPKISIEFKLPEFCIKTLWFEIGNCPNIRGGENAKTTAVTTCLSIIQTEVTGCSVLNSVTTVTTTRTGSEKPYPTCGPDVCGDNCPAPSATSTSNPTSTSQPPLPLLKRGDPANGEWRGPEDYQLGYDEFMPEQIREARNAATDPNPGPGGYKPKLLRVPPSPYGPSPQFQSLNSMDNVETLAIDGLWGCTAVVVVSNRGAWVSYFSEALMGRNNLNDFRSALADHRLGSGEGDPMREWNEYGIENLMNDPGAGDHGVIFGDENNDDENIASLNIQAFIITPRPRYSYYNDDGTPRTDRFLQNPNHFNMQVLYPLHVDWIRQDLNSVFQNRLTHWVTTLDYPTPMLLWSDWKGYQLNHLTPQDTVNILKDVNCEKARGKTIVQYKPAESCNGRAEWRIFSDTMRQQGESRWVPEDGQVWRGGRAADEMDLDPDQPGLARRKVCPRPSLTTSSCSVTVTATHQTVFCSVSKAVAVGNATQTTATTTCLSSAYTTVTGCSVANSVVTTTVATTQTSSARALPTCGPDSCGSCQPLHLIPPQEPPQESFDEPKQQSVPRPLAKRGDTAYGFWQDIHDSHSGYRQWMPAQIRQARLASQNPFPAEEGAFRPTLLKAMPEGFDLPVSTKFVLFKDKPETLAIEGLWGCIVVLVVSNRGAWAAYFWERTMYDEQEMTQALDQWRHGTGEDKEMFQYNERGLDQLTDYERDGDVGVMFGNPADEDVNHLNIKAFIFAPRRKPVYRNPDGSSTDDLNNEHFAAGAVDPDFEDSVELIIRDLQRKFNGEIEIDVVDYPRPTLTLADYDWWMGLPDDVAMSDRFLVPVIKTLMDDVCRVHRGKVILQYQPSRSACQGLTAKWRVFADVYGQVSTGEWLPEEGQRWQGADPPAEGGAAQKRQKCARGVCDTFSVKFMVVAERYLVIYFASQHVNPDDKTALNKLQLTFNDKIEHNINTTFQHTLDQQHSVFFDHIKCDIYNTVQYTLDEQYCTFHHDIEHDHSTTARHNLVERHFFVWDIDQNNIPDGDKQALVDNVNNILIHSQENNDTNS
ncbi:unnamed protein product [Colletotrichum noveboracense]|uniref:Uncharacterized protein n=1 Tax=Colletotrichum noveboracense TaxID=2664923 RepID=A0A9W4S3I1_9PEZI|nr:unnamed protein product [Colletotrichum noveboracense]